MDAPAQLFPAVARLAGILHQTRATVKAERPAAEFLELEDMVNGKLFNEHTAEFREALAELRADLAPRLAAAEEDAPGLSFPRSGPAQSREQRAASVQTRNDLLTAGAALADLRLSWGTRQCAQAVDMLVNLARAPQFGGDALQAAHATPRPFSPRAA